MTIKKIMMSFDKYQAINGSFEMDIICDGEIVETIEEKEIVLDTNYVEERKTVLGVMMSQ